MIQTVRDKIWNALFLDFYLDPHWTLEFKILNLISGDALREYLSSAQQNLKKGMDGNPAATHILRERLTGQTAHGIYGASKTNLL